MKLSSRLTILASILILAQGDRLDVAAGQTTFSASAPSNDVYESPAFAGEDSLLGPKGDCHGRIFFLYPVFKKLQVAPGEREIAFRGLEGIRSLIVLVSDRTFVFEMHGQRFEPVVTRAPIPSDAYVLLEWSPPSSFLEAVGAGPERKLAAPSRGFPIEERKGAIAAAAQHLGDAQCRIVQNAGFLDVSAAPVLAWEDPEHDAVFGSNIFVEPRTEVTVMTSPQSSVSSSHEPVTIWISLIAAWQYQAEDP